MAKRQPELVQWAQVATPDGLRLDGWLHPITQQDSPDGAPTTSSTDEGPSSDRRQPVVLLMHGAGANGYGASLINRVGTHLHRDGWPVLRVNNRGHDGWHVAFRGGKMIQMGSAFERLHESVLDVLAWVGWLKRAGYGPVWLVGHSLGAFKSLYTVSENVNNGDIAGIVAISPPCLSQQRFTDGDQGEVFQETIRRCQRLIEQEKETEVFWATYPFNMMLAPGCYLDKYASGERYSFNAWTHKLTLPVYWVFGEKELQTHQALRQGVQQLQNEFPSQHDFKIFPDADHFFTGVTRPVCVDVTSWMESRH